MTENDIRSICSRMTAPVALALLAAVSFLLSADAARAEGYGSVSGQFILTGEIPEPEVLVPKDDLQIGKDAACAKEGVLSEEVVVDSESKGIANVFIFKRTADNIHPDLQKSKEDTVVFDQKGCQFEPHAMLVRTDQTVKVKSNDNCAHNTHTYPIRNTGVNFILQPMNRDGVDVSVPTAEILPTNVKCDIHPWMSAYWLILDHPYAAITDKYGKFTIEDLPEGEHELRIWHERSGYLVKPYPVVTIKAGETTTLPPFEIPVEKLAKK